MLSKFSIAVGTVIIVRSACDRILSWPAKHRTWTASLLCWATYPRVEPRGKAQWVPPGGLLTPSSANRTVIRQRPWRTRTIFPRYRACCGLRRGGPFEANQ